MRQHRSHASADVARPQPRPAVGLNAGRQGPWRAGIRLDGRRVRRGGKQIAVHRNVPAVFERAQQTIGRYPPMFIHHAQRPEFLFLSVFVNAGMLQIQQHRLQLAGSQRQQAVVAEIEPRPQIVQPSFAANAGSGTVRPCARAHHPTKKPTSAKIRPPRRSPALVN